MTSKLTPADEAAGFSRKVPGHPASYPPLRSFPVTIRHEIGVVELNDTGSDHTAIEAAFLLIARYSKDGVYEFLGPDEGTTTRVTVEWTA